MTIDSHFLSLYSYKSLLRTRISCFSFALLIAASRTGFRSQYARKTCGSSIELRHTRTARLFTRMRKRRGKRVVCGYVLKEVMASMSTYSGKQFRTRFSLSCQSLSRYLPIPSADAAAHTSKDIVMGRRRPYGRGSLVVYEGPNSDFDVFGGDRFCRRSGVYDLVMVRLDRRINKDYVPDPVVYANVEAVKTEW
ncbi:hypothetical protein BKA58DRAFT_455269 [Alternaria rosae]|uniref:uncharacterized protein n=1 Tax=Alternaria rosae TaxID=1187941 RepID=UPI001E8ECA0C|nr:uncharacterized protein BKA58DRAFT_455269 [Alternaria rosae]KAH6876165.1 hypothetical protein BKA58DRAFT_455269 [Alternaria rosae]